MNENVPRYLFHNGGWWVRRDESPAVPRFGEMDQRLSQAIAPHLPQDTSTRTSTHTPPPRRDAR
jgi:hypothetical protein